MSRPRVTAKTRARTSAALKLVSAGARDADPNRVAQAQRRIAAGWYNRSEVRDRVVEAVLEEIRDH